jgi:hypothetical protein
VGKTHTPRGRETGVPLGACVVDRLTPMRFVELVVWLDTAHVRVPGRVWGRASRGGVAIAAVAVAAATFGAGLAGAKPSIGVPRTTAVGADVRVTLRGFQPRRKVEVHLAPTINRGGNCCGIQARLRSGRRTNAAGRAVARFRWPAHYLRCGASSGCERVRWLQGQRVDVIVLVGTVRRIKVIRLIA